MYLKGLQKYQRHTDQNQGELCETKPATRTEQPSTLSHFPVKPQSATNSSHNQPGFTLPAILIRVVSSHSIRRLHRTKPCKYVSHQLPPGPQSSARPSPHATPSPVTAVAQHPIGVTFSCIFLTSKPPGQCLKNGLIPGNYSPLSYPPIPSFSHGLKPLVAAAAQRERRLCRCYQGPTLGSFFSLKRTAALIILLAYRVEDLLFLPKTSRTRQPVVLTRLFLFFFPFLR